jgi:hypothetical protein
MLKKRQAFASACGIRGAVGKTTQSKKLEKQKEPADWVYFLRNSQRILHEFLTNP